MPSITSSDADIAGSVSTITSTVTPSGSNRIIYAALSNWGTVAPTSITAGGASMGSPIASLRDNAEIITWRLYRYLNPAASSTNVVATFAASNTQLQLLVVALDGVDQTTPDRTPATGAVADSTAISLTPTSQTGDLVIDFLTGYIGGGSFSPGAGQTAWKQHDPGPGSEVLAGSSEAGAAGTTTMSWGAIDGQWTSIALAVIAASGGGGASLAGRLSLLGVGR